MCWSSYWYEEHTKEGYQFIKTPIMMSKELVGDRAAIGIIIKDNMYTTMVDEREFAIKPMNCPGAMLVYNSTLHSYKDLPLRMGELGQVHRHEASGALERIVPRAAPLRRMMRISSCARIRWKREVEAADRRSSTACIRSSA